MLLLILLLFPLFNSLRAQNNDLQAGLTNAGFASIIGGVGALLNKKEDEKVFPALLKGMGQGALGGYLIFESKRVIRSNKNNEGELFWLAKFVNATGNSILNNAAANRDFYERWFINIGFNKLEIDFTEKPFFSYRLLPFALYGTVKGFTEGDFSLKLSLRSGTPVFKSQKIQNDLGLVADGKAIFNTVILLDDSDSSTVLRHEIIHTFQYENFMGINNFWKPFIPVSVKERPIYQAFSTVFYLDLNAAYNSMLITWQNQEVGYHNNILENEAYYFARD